MQKILVISFLLLILVSACNKKPQKLSPSEEDLIFKAMQYQLSNIDSSRIIAGLLDTMAKNNNKELLLGFSNLIKTRYHIHHQKRDSAIATIEKAREIFAKLNYKCGINMANNEILNMMKYYPYPKYGFEFVDCDNKDSIFFKLLFYEKEQYRISNKFILEDSSDADSIIIINNEIIAYCRTIDSTAVEYTKDVFYARHLLAKAYYLQGRILGGKQDTSGYLENIKYSLHYDLLLNNRQAWSCFTLVEIYLDLAERNTSNRSIYLDSALKYITLEYHLLNLKKHPEKNLYALTDSLINDASYFYHLSHLINDYAKFMYDIGKTDTAFELVQKNVKILFSKFIPYYEVFILQINEEKINEEQKNKKLITILLTLIVPLFIIMFLMFRYLKQRNRLKISRQELESANVKLKKEKNKLSEAQKKIEKTNKKLEDEIQLRKYLIDAITHQYANYIISPSVDKKQLKRYMNMFYSLSNKDIVDKNEKVVPFDIIEKFQVEYEAKKFINNNIRNRLWSFYADKTIVELIIYNILTNALKHNEKEKNLQINVFGDVSVGENKTEVVHRLIIADNGKGVDENELENLFELRKDKGIGLFLSKKLIERLDGNISVEINPKGGLTFTINFKNFKH